MLLDLTKLIQNFDHTMEINEVITFDKEYYKNTEIIDMSKIVVKGTISKSPSSIYEIHLTITGTLILPCSITLKEVSYPISIEVNENLNENEENGEEYLKITGNYLDIIPIVWQNIVMVQKEDTEEGIKEKALANDNILRHTEGKTIVKVIVIKDRIVNIVVK